MPELPEIETIKRELKRTLLGKKIVGVLIRDCRPIQDQSKQKFANRIKGTRIKAIFRRGKALIFKLLGPKGNVSFLVMHLRMSGQLIYPGNNSKARVSFRLSKGIYLDFNDQRCLGEIMLLDDWRQLPFFKRMGPEPFTMNNRDFSERLSARNAKIKSLLMNQSFIAGIGNIYAAEALFKAKIAPFRKAQTLSHKEAGRLFKSIVAVLTAAINRGGSSIDQYVRSNGKKGGYAQKHKLYDREGKPCFLCQSRIKRTTLAGRGTYFCPRCQK